MMLLRQHRRAILALYIAVCTALLIASLFGGGSSSGGSGGAPRPPSTMMRAATLRQVSSATAAAERALKEKKAREGSLSFRLAACARRAGLGALFDLSLRARLRLLRFVIVIVAAVGTAAAIAAASLVFWACYDPHAGQDADCLGRSTDSDVLKVICSIATALLLVLLVARAYTEYLDLRRRGLLLSHESFVNSPLLPPLLLEMVVCGIHCPAYVYGNSAWPNLDTFYFYDHESLFSAWHLLRVYLLVQLFADVAGFESPHARVIAKFNGVKLDALFAYRAITQNYPLATVFFIFGMSIVMEGYALHVFERPVCATRLAIDDGWCANSTMGLKDFSSFSVAMWNAIVTGLTIGEFAMTRAVPRPPRTRRVCSRLRLSLRSLRALCSCSATQCAPRP